MNIQYSTTMKNLTGLLYYEKHLRGTGEWLLRSIAKGNGGSCAYFSPLVGWSQPYPETTGYLIPTLLQLYDHLQETHYREEAISIGRWLLSIQLDRGPWQGGLYRPNRLSKPSVFNTGQILKGLVALFHATQHEQWLDAAKIGAVWLAESLNDEGLWPVGDYQAEQTPSYYTSVAWPMLEVWSLTQNAAVRDAAERYLAVVLSRRLENGAYRFMGFNPNQPAFTHTIAYTLRGLLESARLTDNWARYGEPCVRALEFFLEKAQLLRGNLPGAYDEQWRPQLGYSCLTGNVQLAICLLIWEARQPDLRIVNGAARLIDYTCGCQTLKHPVKSIRGGVAGSHPLWAPYMKWRYPNWAAKYHCDALMRLYTRLAKENDS